MITDAILIEGLYQGAYLEFHRAIESRPVAPNPMFDELSHFVTRFMRPGGNEKWRCPVCGKPRGNRWFWTQIVPFRASLLDRSFFVLVFSDVLEPLTPVCADHVLAYWFDSSAVTETDANPSSHENHEKTPVTHPQEEEEA